MFTIHTVLNTILNCARYASALSPNCPLTFSVSLSLITLRSKLSAILNIVHIY